MSAFTGAFGAPETFPEPMEFGAAPPTAFPVAATAFGGRGTRATGRQAVGGPIGSIAAPGANEFPKTSRFGYGAATAFAGAAQRGFNPTQNVLDYTGSGNPAAVVWSGHQTPLPPGIAESLQSFEDIGINPAAIKAQTRPSAPIPSQAWAAQARAGGGLTGARQSRASQQTMLAQMSALNAPAPTRPLPPIPTASQGAGQTFLSELEQGVGGLSQTAPMQLAGNYANRRASMGGYAGTRRTSGSYRNAAHDWQSEAGYAHQGQYTGGYGQTRRQSGNYAHQGQYAGGYAQTRRPSGNYAHYANNQGAWGYDSR